jgi:hypothetical protein
MPFELLFTEEAAEQLAALDRSNKRKARKVRATLGRLQSNPRHPSLQTHEYDTLSRVMGQKVFEAYVENRTPGAFRVFWHYGPEPREMTILSIVPHP